MKRLLVIAAALTVAVAADALANPPGGTSIDSGDRLIKGNLTVQGSQALAAVDAGNLWVRGGLQSVGTVTAQQLLTAAVIDAGSLYVRGDEQVAGTVRINGTLAMVGQNGDAGTAALWAEVGWAVCSGSAATVTFNHTFATSPICTLSTKADAGNWPVLEDDARTTGFTIHCGGASSRTYYQCIGDR